MNPQDVVERALAASAADDCIVIASVTHSANIRWANNSLTTNGVLRSTDLTVVSLVGAQPRVASLTRTGVAVDEITAIAEASHAAALDSPVADDAAPLLTETTSPSWDSPPGETSVDALAEVAHGLAAAFDLARGRDEGRYGYAEHCVTTTYVGSSRGLRLRDEQPDGRLELTGR